MSYIEKKFFREGQNETPSQIDLYKNRSNGELVYRDPNGIEIVVSPQGGLESIINIVNNLEPKYKVYTALLTQSGGNNSEILISSGLLTIGVTYKIEEILSGNPDWTNVGAPNNEVGTYFVATGTTPNSWGGGEATLAYSEAAPVVTVLENTIGNIWFNYLEVGRYEINLSNPIDIDKTFLYIGNGPTVNQLVYFEEAGIKTITFYGLSGSESKLMIYSSLDGYNSFSDGRCNKTPIEIRVYN